MTADEPVVAHAPGRPRLLLGAYDLADVGYTDDEFFVSGAATRYAPVGDHGPDGRWQAAPSGSADYTIRIVVMKPVDGFNGTVVV